MKVVYPECEWKPIGDSMIRDDAGQYGPSGNDIWLFYPKSPYTNSPYVCHYINWSGLDIEKIKKDGATMWADVVKPEFPQI